MPHTYFRRARLFAIGLTWCFVGAGVGGSAFAQSYSEAAIKAAYLHRFAAYVQWPADAGRDVPFVIGIYGADDVAEELERLLPGLKIQDRRALVQRVEPGDQLAQLQILFIGSGQMAAARDTLVAAERLPILIVTDDEGGLARGGVINFVRVERNVRFEVSLKAAQRNSLKITSGLLSVAARVEDGPRSKLTCLEPALGPATNCAPRAVVVSTAEWQKVETGDAKTGA